MLVVVDGYRNVTHVSSSSHRYAVSVGAMACVSISRKWFGLMGTLNLMLTTMYPKNCNQNANEKSFWNTQSVKYELVCVSVFLKSYVNVIFVKISRFSIIEQKQNKCRHEEVHKLFSWSNDWEIVLDKR